VVVSGHSSCTKRLCRVSRLVPLWHELLQLIKQGSHAPYGRLKWLRRVDIQNPQKFIGEIRARAALHAHEYAPRRPRFRAKPLEQDAGGSPGQWKIDVVERVEGQSVEHPRGPILFRNCEAEVFVLVVIAQQLQRGCPEYRDGQATENASVPLQPPYYIKEATLAPPSRQTEKAAGASVSTT
jgi:hypothetical protein